MNIALLAADRGRRRARRRPKIAVVLHRMWVDGSDFRLGSQEAAA